MEIVDTSLQAYTPPPSIKDLPITRENIRNHCRFRPFVFDTETTGFHGCTIFHKNVHILSISAIDMCSEDEYNAYIKHPDAIITPQSTEVHSITDDIIKSNNARDPHTVLKEFLLWVYERAGDKEVVFFAHNASYDLLMLLKSLPIDCGKEGVHLKFRVVCTLEIIKRRYPDIKYNAFLVEYQDKICKGRPHSLASLSKYFFGKQYQNLHDSIVDCRELDKIVLHFIMPHIIMDLEENIHEVDGLIKSRHLDQTYDSMFIKLRDVKFIRGFVWCILPHINDTYRKHQMGHLVTNNNLISVFDVFTYGYLKTREETTSTHDDIWYRIVIHVEILLRLLCNIYADDIHCELFGHMTNRSPLEFALNTKVKGEDRPIYPSLAGLPVSYLPFNFSEDLSSKIYKILGIRTAHELYLDYHFSLMPLKRWVNKVLGTLKSNSYEAFSEDICEENFKKIVKKFD